ncbi:helix-turn-helix domain-containing protein [Bordetella pertussis]|nr:helix-turn-helix domain-containing protein [Bordetella pertussis]
MLELLTAFPDGLALSELSAMIELPKASAHRLIKTLQELELAATSSPGSATYVTGPRLRKLAFMSADAQWVVAILRPFLRELTQEMGETAFVARLEGALGAHDRVRGARDALARLHPAGLRNAPQRGRALGQGHPWPSRTPPRSSAPCASRSRS